jgi:hypothetical protein
MGPAGPMVCPGDPGYTDTHRVEEKGLRRVYMRKSSR